MRCFLGKYCILYILRSTVICSWSNYLPQKRDRDALCTKAASMKPSLSHPEQMSPKLPLRCVRKRSLADSIIGTDRNTMVTQPEGKPCRKIWKLPLKAVHRPLVSIQTPTLQHCPPLVSVCPSCNVK